MKFLRAVNISKRENKLGNVDKNRLKIYSLHNKIAKNIRRWEEQIGR